MEYQRSQHRPIQPKDWTLNAISTDIIALNEQWRANRLKNYTGYYTTESATTTSNINSSILIKTKHKHKLIKNDAENCVAIHIQNHNTIVINIYIRPLSSKQNNDHVRRVIDLINRLSHEYPTDILVVLGDFNRNTLIHWLLRDLGFNDAMIPGSHKNHDRPDHLKQLQHMYYKNYSTPSIDLIQWSLRL